MVVEKNRFLFSETENNKMTKRKFLVHISKSYLLKTFPENQLLLESMKILFSTLKNVNTLTIENDSKQTYSLSLYFLKMM